MIVTMLIKIPIVDADDADSDDDDACHVKYTQ